MTRKHNLKFFILMLCPFLTVACTQSCTQQSPEEETQTTVQGATQETSNNTTDKTFVYCSEGSPENFNPQLATSRTSANAGYPVYNRLFDYKHGTTKIIPSLAEKNYEINNEGKEYIIPLKKNIKFHTTEYFTPTRDMNADDVIFSFKRQMDPKHPYHNVSGGIYEIFSSMSMNKTIQDIVKIDEHKVKFVLSQPDAPFLNNIAFGIGSILSKEYADNMLEAKTPEKIDHYPIGTGPFVFEDYIKDSTIQYKAFPDYFDKRGNIQTLVFAITPDANVRLQKLRNNECHLIAYPDPADFEIIKRNENLTLLEKSGLNVGYLAINVTKRPFDNVLVRQALNHALNRDSYINAVYLNHAQIAHTPLPPASWGHNDQVQKYDYNIDKAKALLKKAGLTSGFETDLWILPVSRPYIPSSRRLGEMMQRDLAKVGIRVNLVTYDWGTYLDKLSKGEHVLAQIGWIGDTPDPDNFLYTLLSCDAVKGGSNNTKWCHVPYDDLVNKAKISTDTQERTQLYKEAQMIFSQQVPWVPLAYAKVYRAIRKNISGYQIDPLGRAVFTYVEVK